MSPSATTTRERLHALSQQALIAFAILHKYPVLVPAAVIMLLGEINYSGINNVTIPTFLNGLPMPSGARTWLVGAMASTFLLAETLFRMPSGWFSDRYGRARIITIGLFLTAPSFLMSALAPHANWLFPLRAWDGIMAAAIFTSVYAIIGDAVPERFRANAMGVINAMYMIGMLLGYATAGGIDALTGNPRNFLFLSAGIALCAGTASLLFFRRYRGLNDAHPEVHLEEAERAVVSVARHVVLLIVTFAQNLALTIIAPYMYLFAAGRNPVPAGGLGLSLNQMGLLVGAPLLGVALFAVPLSRLADKIGKLLAVRLAFTLVAGTLWIFAVTRELWLLSLAATVVGIAFSMGVPAWLAIISSLASSKTRGVTLGGYGAVQGIAAVIGPLVGSFISTRFGLPSIFIASAITVALAAILTWVALPNIRPESPQAMSIV